jgi:hypothetical protein
MAQASPLGEKTMKKIGSALLALSVLSGIASAPAAAQSYGSAPSNFKADGSTGK